MVDPLMPEPSDEFLVSTRHTYSKSMAAHIKNFSGRINLAHTLNALVSLKRDIERSDLNANAAAKEELKTIANKRAIELGFKPPDKKPWW